MPMPAKPSKHLTWRELACKDGTPYPAEFIQDGRCYDLCRLFEKIRSLYGKPIVVLSAYRTPEHNRRVGGARNSQHMHGRALDLRPPKGISVDRFYKEIRFWANDWKIGGIGKYKTFVHVDIRYTTVLVAWSGNGAKDDTSRKV